jgi:hypothetical protein
MGSAAAVERNDFQCSALAANSARRLTAPAYAFERLESRSLQSPQKIANLTASMNANGWQGDAISVFEHFEHLRAQRLKIYS